MAKRKAEPTITFTEILARAIRCIDADIDVWRKRCDGLPEELFEKRLAECTEELVKKRDALKTLYLMETGVNYD